MATRLQIQLVHLLAHPKVKVELFREEVLSPLTATVTFDFDDWLGEEAEDWLNEDFEADFMTWVEGERIVLLRDFALFDTTNPCHEHDKKLQRALFKCNILHTIIPG